MDDDELFREFTLVLCTWTLIISLLPCRSRSSQRGASTVFLVNRVLKSRTNSVQDFRDVTLNEDWVVLPMSLHITGYGPPTVEKYSDRPTILFEGEMDASALHGIDGDMRRVRGSASMMHNGHVRWATVSSYTSSPRPRWRLT